MANKKTSSSKSKSAKFKRFSNFNPLQALVLVAVFSIIGAIGIYYTHAVTTEWANLATKFGCARVNNNEPATIREGNNGNCTKMLKYVLKNGAGQNLTVDIYFGPATTTAVKNVQVFTGMTNVTYGVVDTKTWDVMQVIYIQWLNRSKPTVISASSGWLEKPSFSKNAAGNFNLNYLESLDFNSQWTKYSHAGWCVIQHESKTAGMYIAIQGGGKGPGTGAFQFQGGYPNPGFNDFGPGSSDTWKTYKGYQYAALAPADVQWYKFFGVYKGGAGGSNWAGINFNCAL